MRNRRPDTEMLEERHDTIVRLTQAGYSLSQIAVRLGVTARTVARHRKLAGLARPIAPRMSEHEIAVARQLLEDGASYSEVRRSTGRSVETLQRHLPGYGWNQTMAAEYRHLRERLDQLRPALETAS